MALDRNQLWRLLQGLPAAQKRRITQQLLGKLGSEVSRSLGGGRAAREVGRVVSSGQVRLGAELARYARGGATGGFLRSVLGRMGMAGRVVSWLLGKAAKPAGVKPSAVDEAVNLLTGLGFEVRMPKVPPEARPGTSPALEPDPGEGTPPEGPALPAAASPGAEPPPEPGHFPGGKAIFMQHVVGSSNVYAFGYDERTLTLRVQYLGATINRDALTGRGHRGKRRVRGQLGATVLSTRRGPGPLYDYHGVPKRVFQRMQAAGSKGKFVWDSLRIRGTAYGHRFDYELVAAGTVDVVIPSFDERGRRVAGRKVGHVTYVPRKAAAQGVFLPRTIRHVERPFRSLLPGTGSLHPPPRDSRG